MADTSPLERLVVLPYRLVARVDACMQANYPGPLLADAWRDFMQQTEQGPDVAGGPEEMRMLWYRLGGSIRTLVRGTTFEEATIAPDKLWPYLTMQARKLAYWAECNHEMSEQLRRPIDMVLHCPECHAPHIDKPNLPEWSNPPHRTHLCHDCGHLWRPASVATNGVAELPKGAKHAE
jgi:hypothetical protein